MSEELIEQKPKQWYLGALLNQSSAQVLHTYVSLAQLTQSYLGFHPEISYQLDRLDKGEAQALFELTGATPNPEQLNQFFVEKLVNVISQHIDSNSQIVRIALSDASSDQLASLVGGSIEGHEINPQLGQRGASRLTSEQYQTGFKLECEVIKQLIAQGAQVEIVVPFVRSMNEAALIIDHLAIQGLPRGLNGLKVLFGCDTPSSVVLADRLLQYFDGVVINAQNLAQFTLAIDFQTSNLPAFELPIKHEAVVKLIAQTLKAALDVNKEAVLYCPQAMQTNVEFWMEKMPELDQVQILLGDDK